MDPIVLTVIRYAVSALLTSIATKTGIAAFSDPTFVTIMVAAVASVGVVLVALWGILASRIIAKAKDVAAVSGTTIVTSPAIAAATPQTNIVSNAENAVVAKAVPGAAQ